MISRVVSGSKTTKVVECPICSNLIHTKTKRKTIHCIRCGVTFQICPSGEIDKEMLDSQYE